MKRIFCLLTAALMLSHLPTFALAQDACVVDAASADRVTCAESYLRVTCETADDVPVMLQITDEAGSLHYQRDYGLISGTFRSEDIYLRLQGATTIYQVTLTAGDDAYAFTVERVMPRLKHNHACSVGYPLEKITGDNKWQSVTLIDVAQVAKRPLTVALHASDAYELGTATFTVENGELSVTLDLLPQAQAEVEESRLYVALDAITAKQLGQRQFLGYEGALSKPVPLGGTPYAAVLLDLTVSFDPAALPASPKVTLDGQQAIWEQMQQHTANESVG